MFSLFCERVFDSFCSRVSAMSCLKNNNNNNLSDIAGTHMQNYPSSVKYPMHI